MHVGSIRIRHRALIAGVAALATFSTLTACGTSPEEAGGTSLTVGVTSLPTAVNNPMNGGYLSFLPMQTLYEPLVEVNLETGQFEGYLAEEFSMSDDRRTMFITLRENIDFVDGEHLDAAAVETYFDAAVQTETWLWYAGLGQTYQPEVTATGEYTLELSTVLPMGRDFFTQFNMGVPSPAGVENPELLEEEARGTGPYVLTEEVTDVSLTFERRDDYWNPDAFPFDEVTFIVFADDVAALNALKSGQIDAAELSNPLAAEAEAEGFRLNIGGGRYGTLVIMDTDGELVPALGDVRVRQAMNMAFDREAITETLDAGFGSVSSQPFTVGQPEYVEGGDERYPYDPEGAKALLAEAGYPDGFDLTIPTAVGEATPYEPIVQQSLADIGIRVTYEPLPDATALYGAYGAGTYPVALMKSYYNNTLLFFKNGLFFAQVLDETGDELIEQIDFGNVEESEQATTEMGAHVLDEAWYVPFSKPATIWASIPEVEIVVGTYIPWPQLRYVTLAD